jgi:hypothetical protein
MANAADRNLQGASPYCRAYHEVKCRVDRAWPATITASLANPGALLLCSVAFAQAGEFMSDVAFDPVSRVGAELQLPNPSS